MRAQARCLDVLSSRCRHPLQFIEFLPVLHSMLGVCCVCVPLLGTVYRPLGSLYVLCAPSFYVLRQCAHRAVCLYWMRMCAVLYIELRCM